MIDNGETFENLDKHWINEVRRILSKEMGGAKEMDGIHYVGTMEFVKKDDLDKAIETIKQYSRENVRVDFMEFIIKQIQVFKAIEYEQDMVVKI